MFSLARVAAPLTQLATGMLEKYCLICHDKQGLGLLLVPEQSLCAG
jgi:hypothetical protein